MPPKKCAERVIEAVTEEREDCAAVADDYARDAVETAKSNTDPFILTETKGRREAATKIAADIRRRGHRNGKP